MNREKIIEVLTERDKDGGYFEVLRYRKDRVGVNNLMTPYDATEELADAIMELDKVDPFVCPNCHEEAELVPLGHMCNKCFYDKL